MYSVQVMMYQCSEEGEVMLSLLQCDDVRAQMTTLAAAASTTYLASKRRLSGK